MDAIVNIINYIFDLLWNPLSRTPFIVDIFVISIISAIIFLLIFKATSDQKQIAHYKGKIFAHILEIRLYKDQPVLTLKSVTSIIKNNLIYLRYSLKPLVVIIIPFLIITIQLNNRYGYLPMRQGQSFIIRAEVDKNNVSVNDDTAGGIGCETSDGLVMETRPIHIDSEDSVFWRVKVIETADAPYYCRVVLNDSKIVEKLIYTDSGDGRFSPVKTKWGWQNFFVNNAEEFIDQKAAINSIRVNYQRAQYNFISWETDPIIIYFILTLVFGFALKPFLKVDF